MNDRTPGIPDLGRLAGPKPRLGINLYAFVRHLDPDGLFEAAGIVRRADGQMVASTSRDQYLDAEQFIDLIAARVTQDIARMLVDAGVIRPVPGVSGDAAPSLIVAH